MTQNLTTALPTGDKRLISFYNIMTWSNIQVTITKETITKDECLNVSSNSPNDHHKKYKENTEENMHFDVGA